MNSKNVLDSLDWKILAVLQRNARLTNTEIGKRVGLSQPATQCMKTFERIPEILEVYRITGEDCLLVKGTFARMSDLERTIDALSEFGSVTTSIILASYTPKPLMAETTLPK